MSLTKQLWLAIAAVMTFAFVISFLVSVGSGKAYLEDQLRLKNIDNANALALSLTQIKKDPVLIESLLSTQFDVGHYQQIKLTSATGQVMVDRVSDVMVDEVPAWFVNLIPLRTEPGIAQVQDGWRQYGTLTMASHNRFAYQALWEGNRRLLGWFLASTLLCGLIGSLVLRSITRPLVDVVNQAEAIGVRRFITIREPRTREFRALVRAMNALSRQVRSMLDEESARLDQLRRDAQHDALTGLLNREHFMQKAQHVLADEKTDPTGALFILRMPDLVRLNHELGREATDALLKRVADALKASCPDEVCHIGRLNGSDFAVLVPNVDSVDELAHRIVADTQLSINDPSQALEHGVVLGATAYRHGDPVSQVLARADVALSRAKQEGGIAVEVGDPDSEWKPVPSAASTWQVLIETALRQKRVQFVTYPVLDPQGGLVHYEAPARMQNIENAQWMPAQEFMPWASRLGLTERIDRAVFDCALDWLETNDAHLCINVSPQSVCDPALAARYYRALKNSRRRAKKLWIGIPECVAYSHPKEFRVFCEALKPLGCKIGLEHVGNQVCHLGELHDVGLDYLRIDGAIIRDIHQSVDNQAFLKGLCGIAHTMGMMTIAEGVSNQQELACLKEIGFKAMTGPGIILD
jgi:diguanylate cyclase (GGDEF)-like protein